MKDMAILTEKKRKRVGSDCVHDAVDDERGKKYEQGSVDAEKDDAGENKRHTEP